MTFKIYSSVIPILFQECIDSSCRLLFNVENSSDICRYIGFASGINYNEFGQLTPTLCYEALDNIIDYMYNTKYTDPDYLSLLSKVLQSVIDDNTNLNYYWICDLA